MNAGGNARRLRILVLAGTAILCGGLAASAVGRHEARVRAQVGPLVPVLVAAKKVPRGKLLTPGAAHDLLAQRRVPGRFVPPNGLRRLDDAVGFQTVSGLDTGDYVTAAGLVAPQEGKESVEAGKAGGRLVEVAVSGGTAVLDRLQPGSFVDVLVTSDRGGAARTYLALQRVLLVGSGAADPNGTPSGSNSDHPADASAILRVSLRQAIVLTAAQNFAREVRLVARPEGDSRIFAPASVSASQLRP